MVNIKINLFTRSHIPSNSIYIYIYIDIYIYIYTHTHTHTHTLTFPTQFSLCCSHYTWTIQSVPIHIDNSDTNNTHRFTQWELCWDYSLFCHGCLTPLLLSVIVWHRPVSYWRFVPLCCPEMLVTDRTTPCNSQMSEDRAVVVCCSGYQSDRHCYEVSIM